jgi:phytoene dehydrogenase-like protein
MTELGKLKDKYDVIIIGAGIGGLTCGCYLAKAGKKGLIVEQHGKVGGYCSSFKRNGFSFDSCIHYLGSCRQNGQLRIVLKELDLENEIKIVRSDPTDIIVTQDYQIPFYNDINKTISHLKAIFVSDKDNIESFFKLLQNDFMSIYTISRRYNTFADLLDKYFKNNKLKLILGYLLSNLGLLASETSARAGLILYKEFILDGGYYPTGGMQKFSNTFANKFKEFGGDMLLNKKVKQIIIENNKAKGVILNDKSQFYAQNIISACDSKETYLKMIEEKKLKETYASKINSLVPSTSVLIVYLGMNKQINHDFACGGLWYFPEYYKESKEIDITRNNNMIGPVFCTIPSLYDSSSSPKNMGNIRLSILASYKNRDFWKENKIGLAKIMVSRIERVIPGLANDIIAQEIATPDTLHRYTLNYQGAISGWASIPSQYEAYLENHDIGNLYQVGHWGKLPGGQGGVSMVASLGRLVAKFIVRKK